MAALIDAILTCLTGTSSRGTHTSITEKQPLAHPAQARTAEEAATQIVDALLHAEKAGPHLKHTLDTIVHPTGWTETIAEWVLTKLEAALHSAEKLRGPMKEAYEKSCTAALAIEGLAQEHPAFVTGLALGVLVVIAPWVLEVLGFAELGPIEGTFPPSSLPKPRNKPNRSDPNPRLI